MIDTTRPRIVPLSEPEWSPTVAAMVSYVGPLNVVTTVGRHPDLCKPLFGVGVKLLFKGRLPDRQRELAILRLAHHASCLYEQVHHAQAGREAGLSPAEISAVSMGLDSHPWHHIDHAVLAAVDELCDSDTLGDHIWNVLSRQYHESQIIELLVLIGYYRMLAGVLNSLRVPVEDWAAQDHSPTDKEGLGHG